MSIDSVKLYEVQKYCSLTAHVWDPFILVANRRSFSRLPADIQDVVRREFDRSMTDQRMDIKQGEKPSRNRSQRKGWSSSTSTEHHSAKRCVSPAITELGRKRLEPTAGKALSNRSAVSCKGTVAAPTRKAAR